MVQQNVDLLKLKVCSRRRMGEEKVARNSQQKHEHEHNNAKESKIYLFWHARHVSTTTFATHEPLGQSALFVLQIEPEPNIEIDSTILK